MPNYEGDRNKECLFDEIRYFLKHGGTLEALLGVLMDAIKEGEADE